MLCCLVLFSCCYAALAFFDSYHIFPQKNNSFPAKKKILYGLFRVVTPFHCSDLLLFPNCWHDDADIRMTWLTRLPLDIRPWVGRFQTKFPLTRLFWDWKRAGLSANCVRNMPLAPPDFIHCFHTVPSALIIVLGIGRKGPVLPNVLAKLAWGWEICRCPHVLQKKTLATARI